MEPAIVFLIFLAFVILAGEGFRGSIWKTLEALSDFFNHWRGGPPPTHPLPGNDGWIVLRRRRPPAI